MAAKNSAIGNDCAFATDTFLLASISETVRMRMRVRRYERMWKCTYFITVMVSIGPLIVGREGNSEKVKEGNIRGTVVVHIREVRGEQYEGK